jgi:DNA (cytosine-5)-methyltransferase 1
VNDLILEPFAGPGGMSTALAMLGRRAVGVELNQDACRTADTAGHPRVRADVATFPLEHLAGRVEGVAASPPCQAWSKAGKRLGLLDQPRIFAHLAAVTAAGRWVDCPRAGWHDDRSPLVLEPVRWVSVLRPAWVVCEQVPDVLPFWQAVARWLRALGYSAECGLLSAEQFGVPQTRLRAFLVARLDSPVRLPVPTHRAYGSRAPDGPDLFGPGLLPWVSMADALGWGLRDAPCPVVMTARGRQAGPSDVLRGSSWRADWWRRAAADPDRWLLLPSGREKVNDRTLPRPLTDPAMTVAFRHSDMRWQYRNGNQDHTAIRDQDQDQPAPTVHFGARSNWAAERPATAVCGDPRLAGPGHRDRAGGQRQYDEQAVRVEVWQAGVLQSFPADYPWQGTRTSQYRQVGNCVPPLHDAAVVGEVLGVDWQRLLWGLERAS